MAADVPHPDFAKYDAETVPQMAVGSPGKVGELELLFGTDTSGTTGLVRDFARVPYHVSGALDQDPHPDASTVLIQSPTGGIAQGDRLRASIEVESDAIAHISTQSSTKIQSMDANCAESTIELRVGEGAHLDYMPEPMIVFTGARYFQDLSIRLDRNGTAVVGDVVVPGRLARGERFDFERYYSRFSAYCEDTLLFEDMIDLKPERDDLTSLGVLDGYDVFGTCFVVDPNGDAPSMSDAIHEQLQESDARAAATTLPNDAGVVVRVLGDRTEMVQAGLFTAWDHARRKFVGAAAPRGRKY